MSEEIATESPERRMRRRPGWARLRGRGCCCLSNCERSWSTARENVGLTQAELAAKLGWCRQRALKGHDLSRFVDGTPAPPCSCFWCMERCYSGEERNGFFHRVSSVHGRMSSCGSEGEV